MTQLQAGFPVTDTSGGAEQTSRTLSVTVAAGNRRAMAVVVAGEGDGTATQAEVSSLTYGGVSLTRHRRRERSDWSWVEIWILAAPAVGTANLVVTLTEADRFHFGVYVATDVNQTTPLRAHDGADGSGTSTGNQTVASVLADDLGFDGLSLDSTGAAPVPGADQTERWEIVQGSTSNTGASSTQPGSAGGVMSYSWTGSRPWTYLPTFFVHDGGSSGPTYNDAPAGGIVLGGAATTSREFAAAPAGGIVLGGSASTSIERSSAPAGGIVLGGTASSSLERSSAPAGGIVLGGAPASSLTLQSDDSGGIILGGSAPSEIGHGYVVEPAGGIALGGQAVGQLVYGDGVVGGLRLGGADESSLVALTVPAGGLRLGGAAALEVSLALAPAGGIMLAGALSDYFRPAGPLSAAIARRAPVAQLGRRAPASRLRRRAPVGDVAVQVR